MKEYSQNTPWKQEETDTAGQGDFRALLNFKSIPSIKDWSILGSQGVYRTAFTPRATEQAWPPSQAMEDSSAALFSLEPAPLFLQFQPGSLPKKVFSCLWTAAEVQTTHVQCGQQGGQGPAVKQSVHWLHSLSLLRPLVHKLRGAENTWHNLSIPAHQAVPSLQHSHSSQGTSLIYVSLSPVPSFTWQQGAPLQQQQLWMAAELPFLAPEQLLLSPSNRQRREKK